MNVLTEGQPLALIPEQIAGAHPVYHVCLCLFTIQFAFLSTGKCRKFRLTLLSVVVGCG